MREQGHSRLMRHASCLRGRIVLFRPGALGDTLLTLDALAALRAAYPFATLELVGNRGATALLAAAGVVDVATSFEAPEVTNLFRDPPVVAAAWAGAALVVLWLRSPDRLAAAFRASGVPQIIAADPEPSAENIHVADHLVETLAAAGVSPSRVSSQWCVRNPPPQASPASGEGGRRSASPERGQGVRWLLASWKQRATTANARKQVLLHPGSGSLKKNWPGERFAALAARLLARGCPVAALCGPADHAPVSALRALVSRDKSKPTLPVIEPADLATLASVLCQSALVVGNDSGVTHLAATLGLPTVAIFGPTNPQRWAPRGPRVAVVSDHGSWPSVEAVWSAMEELVSEVTSIPNRSTSPEPHATALWDNADGAPGPPLDGGLLWDPKR